MVVIVVGAKRQFAKASRSAVFAYFLHSEINALLEFG
jgi:hypothetical protein